jgi:N-acyl-D-aspartate/D-glutamate deacylase
MSGYDIVLADNARYHENTSSRRRDEERHVFDTVIRGGSVIDGTGAARTSADVAIKDGHIVEIGKISGAARQTIDADGAIVTPGFVDVHTHYDGQFLWDDLLDPSFSNGVTTAIGGNCGVGFAPVLPEHHRKLIELMEGVEEIPDVVLEDGLDWRWKSFPDYLDRLGERHYAIDIAQHMTHAPLRLFVMGERAMTHEAATAEEVATMARLVREGMEAGAIGFSAARIKEHFSTKGEHVPGTFAEDDEFIALAEAMGSTGKGTIQFIPLGPLGDTLFPQIGRPARLQEHDRMVRMAKAANRPLTYTLLQFDSDPDEWTMMLDAATEAQARGVRIHPQVGPRAIGLISALDGYHPFAVRPSYLALAHLTLEERRQAMRDPAVRARILAESNVPADQAPSRSIANQSRRMLQTAPEYYVIGPPLDYEPDESRKVKALAAAAGKTVEEYFYDMLVDDDGTVAAQFLTNYSHGNLDVTREMLLHPTSISGLGDAGAHMRMVCDGAAPSFQLAFWGRDRTRGEGIALERMVKKLTSECADLYGMSDRGRIQVGQKADINVIDFANLALGMPRTQYDLPLGGARFIQKATGYIATMVSGEITRRNDLETGARPGRLVRSKARPRYARAA